MHQGAAAAHRRRSRRARAWSGLVCRGRAWTSCRCRRGNARCALRTRIAAQKLVAEHEMGELFMVIGFFFW